MKQYMRSLSFVKQLLLLSVLSLFSVATYGQESQGKVLINISTKSPILPPDVGTYKADPGKYFNVEIINTEEKEVYVYFGMKLEYLIDNQGMAVQNLAISTPTDRPTNVPYLIAPGTTMLSEVDMRRLFNHIPTSALLFDEGILGRIGTSDFGLLPEGKYRALLTAYLWDRTLVDQTGRISNPIPVSDPNLTGSCEFDVCYKAQAPQFTSPTSMMGQVQTAGLDAIKLPVSNPVLTWSEPIINCVTGSAVTWRYDVVIKEVLRTDKSEYLMTPDQALQQPAFVTRMQGLTQTQYILNTSQLAKLKDGHVYVAQVTARQSGAYSQADFGFAMVENNGKSEYILITPDRSSDILPEPAPVTPTDDDKTITPDDDEDDGGSETEEEEGEEEEEDELNLELVGVDYEIGEDDSTYVFRNPKLVRPDYTGETNHAVLAGNHLETEWERPAFIGGAGEQPDTLKFRYHVKIWTLSGYSSTEEALQQEPFYDAYVKGKIPDEPDSAKPLPKVGTLPEDDKKTAVDVTEDYIKWEDVESFVSMGDILLLRVVPECVNEESVRFFDDDANSVVFTYTDKLSEAFGNACAEGNIQENRKPINIKDADMVGKVVHVGEYNMEMGSDVKQKSGKWSGSGWILWTPFGQKVKVGVKFEGIAINDNYIMYDGVVKSESKSNWDHLKERAEKFKEDMTNTDNLEEWIPDDIFTEWGLDNLVSSATPSALSGYVKSHESSIAGGVNNLAKKVKASKYYDYVRKGYAVYENFMNGDFGHMPDIEVFLPLQLPEKINPSPVDIQIVSMEWEPTRAWINLLGMTTLPDNDITEENILMFGAPHICMDPDRILPGTGNIILFEDLTLNDPKSDFSIKFLAPQNKEKPEDGCMIHWENDALKMLSVKAEMEIPDLIKCDDKGKRIDGEHPKLTVEGMVEDWSNWYASVTMDPFEHEDLPGWTFKATDVTLDLSVKKNHPDLQFPVGYDKSHFPVTKFNPDDAWTGLFIKDITVMMPEGLLKNGDKRFEISGTNMLFDKSGVSASVGLKDIVNTSIDDWALRIKKVAINIRQNDFNGCGMDGDIHVPLTDDEDYIAFTCNMMPVKHDRKLVTAAHPEGMEDKSTTFDFLLKIQPTEDGSNPLDGKLKFDFWLATLKLDNKQTYFLLESIDQGKDATGTDLGYDTKVELCMAGDISVGGETVSTWIQEQLNKLPLKVEMPDIHFTQMRLSNRERSVKWTYGEDVRKAAEEAYRNDEKTKKLAVLGKNKTITLGTAEAPCYFDCGNWSVASAAKKIGPFSFSIENFDYGKIPNSDSVYVQATGKIGFISNGSEPIVTAGTSLRLVAEANLKQKKLKYAGIKFLGCSLDIKTAGMRIYGELDLGGYGAEGSADHDDGYNGKLEFTMPGNLFSIKAAGGYYEHKAAEGSSDDSYSWGYFKAEMDSKAGIHADPLVINRIAGGFYFNCRPTKSKTDSKDKFGGDPERSQGAIGLALGMTMSTTAGEETLKAEVDLLAVYNRKSKRLSTFMFNGNLEAVSGIVKADVSLIYEHTTMNQAKVAEGPVDTKEAKVEKTKDRYLCLNVTVEFGLDSDKLKDKVLGANSKLLEVKANMDAFQANLDKVNLDNLGKEAPKQGLNQLSGDYEKNADGVAKEGDEETAEVDQKTKDKMKEAGIEDFSAGKTKITLEFMITWVKDGTEYPTPKWHLYVGEPDKDKRCTFTYLKYKSKICSVDIGADGYLCLGNELPNNGALPEIPAKITEFLTGHEQEGRSMGADMQKVERSRAKAAKALLDPTSLKGGVMVGASCWGDISINLGLIFGSIESLAGFDASLINYGSSAVCANSRSHMGKNGWYALGQLYAYLAAKLGLHIKIGHLIDREVVLIDAGIGGVLEMGLPNPSWVEGQVRVKMSFLGGLFKLNKKFSFAAGDHCVPFQGNALDGFELFQNVSLGSDSLYEALYLPEFAVTKEEAQKMIFTTNSSLGSHYRLVDPTYSNHLAEETGEDAEKLNLHASRTYVFDMNQHTAKDNTKIGVRLIDMGTKPTELANGKNKLTPSEFKSELTKRPRSKDMNYDTYDGLIDNLSEKDKTRKSQLEGVGDMYNSFASFAALYFNTKEKGTAETSTVMKGQNLSKGEDYVLHETNMTSYINYILDHNKFKNTEEVPVSFREEKGTVFHLTGMDLKKGHSYALVLTGDAYEIDNGRRVWCDYYYDGDNKYHYIKWQQSKIWFFRVKSDAEDKIVGDSINDLTPYVALAYPSVDGTKVKSGSEGYTTAYYNDILKPTIALRRDLSEVLPESDNFNWKLTAYRANEYSEERPNEYVSQQTRKAKYRTSGSCYNIEPETAFNAVSQFGTDASKAKSAGGKYDYSNELYHLQLLHTYYNVKAKKDSTAAVVDLWLTGAPHDVTIEGKSGTFTDNWLTTTSSGTTGKLLPYVEPFVGARPWSNPTITYTSEESKLSDKEIVFDNSKQYDGKPFRLIDPYLYLAYLSKWVFIGDRAVNKYAWDDVEIPFGSESLIFEHNGTVINTEFLKGVENKSLYDFRNDMYATWNDWHYNNPDLPEYPLPVTLGSVGGPTVVNQDNRASTITPLNVHHYDNQSYNLSDLVEDFTAAYEVANGINQKLKTHASTLYDYLAWNWKNNGNTIDDDALNTTILNWNKMHRGQYLEVEYRGVKARVPYYQLPLLFGDCFADNSSESAYFKGVKLNKKDRDFGKTIGKNDMTDISRYNSRCSNLLFFRLLGDKSKDAPSNAQPQAFLRYKSGTNDNCYPYAYSSLSKNIVAWDEFDIHKALKAVTAFSTKIYRVDAYDTNTGLYTVNGSRGAGPWTESVSIDGSSIFAKNMDEMYSKVNEGRDYLSTHLDEPTLYAVYSKDGKTWRFYYTNDVIKYGDTYKGEYVQGAFKSEQLLSMLQNGKLDNYGYMEKLIIDASVANCDIRTIKNWFANCKKLQSIEGLQYLNTSKVDDMSNMFSGCTSLTSLDLSGFDMSQVKNMENMFRNCSALKTLKFTADCPKVTNITGMFTGCSSMEALDLSTLTAVRASHTPYMFQGCSKLKTLKLNTFTPKNINPDPFEGINDCNYMFYGVPKSVTVYHAFDLDERIKEQIPGNAVEVNNPVKAIYMVTPEKEKVLLFAHLDYNLKEKATGDIKLKNTTYKGVLVMRVWKAKQVTETGTTPPWLSLNKDFDRIIIDPSFTASPKSTYKWFQGCSKVKKIEGFKNLRTNKVKQMAYMFDGCTSLETLDVSEFSNMGTFDVKDLTAMFRDCYKLKTLRLFRYDDGYDSGINTTHVESMKEMFKNCRMLNSIEFGQFFFVFNVKDMSGMFMGCRNLEKIVTKDWSTVHLGTPSPLSNMSSMFEGCESLKSEPDFLTNRNFHPENLTSTANMFKDCKSLQTLNLTHFDTRKIKDMSGMLAGCESMTNLNLSSFKTESLKQSANMFNGLNTTSKIYIPYDISSTIYPAQVKEQTHPNLIVVYPAQVLKLDDELVFLCSDKTYSYGDKWNRREIQDVYSGVDVLDDDDPKWNGRSSIKKVTFDPSFAKVMPLTTNRWFWRLTNLESVVGLEYLNTSEVTDMSSMFQECSKLETLPNFNMLNTQKVTSMASMFEDCYALKELDLSNLNTANVTNMDNMFSTCNSLSELNLSNFNTQNLKSMSGMFNYTKMLKLRLDKVINLEDVPQRNAFVNVKNLLVQTNEDQKEAIKDIFVSKLGFVEGVTGYFNLPQYAQAVWTEGNSTLTFIYGMEKKVGDYLGKNKITYVWKGDDVIGGTSSGRFTTNVSWYNDIHDQIKTVVFDKTFAEVTPKTLFTWFKDCSELTTIKGLQNLNTSEATSMESMFEGCTQLTSLDLSSFNTEKVTSMSKMFHECSSLTTLNVSGFNTSNVTQMYRMFKGCSNLQSLDLSNFNVRRVNTAYELFTGDSKLTELRVGRDFVISALGSPGSSSGRSRAIMVSHPFQNIKTLDIYVPQSAWDEVTTNFTEKLKFVEDDNGWYVMEGGVNVPQAIWTAGNTTLTFVNRPLMKEGGKFRGQTITKLYSGKAVTESDPFPAWNDAVQAKVTKVVFDESFGDVKPTSLIRWFMNCKELTAIDHIEYLNTSAATSMSYMFQGCGKLETLDVTHFNTSNCTKMTSMFSGCKILEVLDVTGFETGKVTSMANMFINCSKLKTVDMRYFDTQKVTDMSQMFKGCSNLQSVNISTSNSFAKVTTMESMFEDCNSLQKMPSELFFSRRNEKNISFKKMFKNCKQMTDYSYSIYEGHLDFSKATSTEEMFYNCNNFAVDMSVDVCSTDENKAGTLTSMKSMFEGCSKIKNVTITALNSGNLKDVSFLFKGCGSLETAGVYLAYANDLTTTESMFEDCRSLKAVKGIGSYTSPNLTTMAKMFSNCENIAEIDLSLLITKKVTDMSGTFFGCKKLAFFYISPMRFVITKVKKDDWTFRATYNVKLYLRKFTDGGRVMSKTEMEKYAPIVKNNFAAKFTQAPNEVLVYNIDWLQR